MDRRRSGLPGPSGSHIPKRAPSPSSAAFNVESSTRIPQHGPLGAYRPSSRDGSVEPSLHATPRTAASASTSSAPQVSRFGFAKGQAAPPSSSIGKGIPSLSSRVTPLSSSKRSISNAGLQDNGVESASPSTSRGNANKRPFLASTASTQQPTTETYDHMENEYKRRELLSQQAYGRLQQEYNAKGRELEKEREERSALVRQWESAREEYEEDRKKLNEERKMLKSRVNTLQERNNDISQRIDEAESAKTHAEHKAHSTKTELGIVNANLEARLATALEDAQSQAQAKQRLEADLQARQAEWDEERARLQDGAGKGNTEESARLTSELSELLAKVRKLEAENLTYQREAKVLQARKESIETLKEQKRDLEKKVGVVEQLRRKLAEAEAEVDELKTDKQAWMDAVQSERQTQKYQEMFSAFSDTYSKIPKLEVPETLTASSASSYMSSLHGALAGLVNRSDTLDNRSNHMRKEFLSFEESIQNERERMAQLEHELSESKMAKLKSDKARETMTAEVDGYRRLLETYQQEAQNMSAQFDGASVEQIRLLEEQLQSRSVELQRATQEHEELRKKLSALTAPGGLSADEKRRMEKEQEVQQKELLHQLGEKESAYEELEKQCISLGKANDDLFARLGRGEFDQSKLRVLELSNNPVSQDRVIRTSTLDALRKENTDLLEQVKDLSSRAAAATTLNDDAAASSSNAGMIPAQTLDNLQNEYEKLQQAMRDRDKAFDRLKEAFGAKATEYVAAVKSLFGYDMHVLSRGKVKLRSTYARTSKGTSLTFDAGEEGDVANMRLVGEARQGAANVANLKRYWLGADRCSVPCFLAALQLELYESTTQAVRVGWTEDED